MAPPGAAWPPGLRDEVLYLDDGATNDLPRLACLAIGAPVVLHISPQFVLLGVCNNSDGIIHGIDLDVREECVQQEHTGYSVINLRYPPVRVLVYLKSADDAGLKLPGLPRGVIAVVPVQKNFTVPGMNGRTYTIRRQQLPLTPGCLTSVYRSQGMTLK